MIEHKSQVLFQFHTDVELLPPHPSRFMRNTVRGRTWRVRGAAAFQYHGGVVTVKMWSTCACARGWRYTYKSCSECTAHTKHMRAELPSTRGRAVIAGGVANEAQVSRLDGASAAAEEPRFRKCHIVPAPMPAAS